MLISLLAVIIHNIYSQSPEPLFTFLQITHNQHNSDDTQNKPQTFKNTFIFNAIFRYS